MSDDEVTTRVVPEGHEDHEDTILVSLHGGKTELNYKVTSNGVVRPGQKRGFDLQWDACLSYYASRPGGKPTAMMMHKPPINHTPSQSIRNTWVPFIWPRTWIQAYIVGVLDMSVIWIHFQLAREDLESRQDLRYLGASFSLLAICYMGFRCLASVEWEYDQRFAGTLLSNDIEAIPHNYGALIDNEEVKINVDNWPVFKWPIHAYFAGVLELIAWGLGTYTIFGTCSLLVALSWVLGRLLHEHTTGRKHEAYVLHVISN